MKRIFAPIILVVILFLNCSAVDELTKFNIDYETDYAIPSSTIINTPFSLNTPDVPTESSSTFESNNTNKDLIESIKLKKIRLTLQDPEDGDFNFLKQIYIYISSENVEEVEIANLTDIENNSATTLELEILNQELKEYIKEDSFKLRVKTITDETINQTHHIKIYTQFRVDAEILGI